MSRVECLTEDELTAFNLGNLSEEEAAAVTEHLESCPCCEAVAARLDGETDAVIAALRDHPPATDISIHLSTSRATPSLTFTNLAANEQRKAKPIAVPPPTAIGDYAILSELGRGGMGVVYKARHTRLNRIVALKMVLGGAYAETSDLSRFVSEAEIVAQLAHPNIVQIYEVGHYRGQPFLALEYVEGPTLAEQLRKGTFTTGAAATLIEQLARAVHHAHLHGIIHRDLKPANILLTTDGVPKVTDFGLAKNITQGTNLTTTGTILGTPAYMAPEQAQSGHGPVGIPADVHALGVILYELLSGAPPYDGATPVETAVKVATMDPPPLSHRRPRLPRDLITICMRCLEKDPHRRYASAHALATDLRSFLNGDSILARRAGQMERAWKWTKKRPAIAALLAAVLLALIAGTAVSTYFALDAHARAVEAESARDRADISAANAIAAESRAQTAKDDALRAKRTADLRSAELIFRAGIADAESGFVDRGLNTMLQAARALPEDAVDFRRVLDANLSAWSQRLPQLQILANSTRPCFIGANGDTFAICGPNGLEFWNTATATRIDRQGGPKLSGCVLASSSDAQIAFMQEGTGDEECRLRSLATGELIGRAVPGRRDQFRGYTFAPGDQILCLERDYAQEPNGNSEFAFWDIPNGKWMGPTVRSECHLVQDRSGKLVLMTIPFADGAFADALTSAQFQDFATREKLDHVEFASSTGDRTIHVDSGGIVTVSHQSLVRWWGPSSGKQRRPPWQPPSAVPGFFGGLTADGGRLMVLCTDQHLRWYEIATGRQCGPAVPTLGDHNSQIAMRPDGAAVLFTENYYQTTWLWRMDRLSVLPGNPLEPEARFTAAAYSPDRRTALAVSNRHAMVFRCGLMTDVATGQPKGLPLRDEACFPVFSADGKFIATCTAPTPDHTTQTPSIVRVWNADSGEPTGKVFRPPTYAHGLAFAPEGHLLAVGCIGAVFLWDIDEPAPRSLLPLESAVSQLAFSPDGKWIAASSRAGWTGERACLGLWSVASGQRVGELITMIDAPILCFSSDNRTLFSFELAGSLARWDVATMRPLNQVSPDNGPGSGLQLKSLGPASRAIFRPDRKCLVTGQINGVARQWDLATGEPVGPAMSSTVPVTALAYSADSKVLAIGYADGATRLWDAHTSLPLGPPLMQRYGIIGLAFTKDGGSLLITENNGVTTSAPVHHAMQSLLSHAPNDKSRAANIDLLEAWFEAISGTRANSDAITLLSSTDWRRRCETLQEAWPEAAQALNRPMDLASWYDQCAKDAQAANEPDSALWNLDRFIAAASEKDPSLKCRKAQQLSLANRLQEAEAEYGSAAAADRAGAMQFQRHQAAMAELAGRWQSALWHLDRLIGLEPTDGRLYAERSIVRMRLRNAADAEADAVKAEELGADQDFLEGRAEKYAQNGDWPKAAALFAQAAQRGPMRLELWQRFWLTRLELGDRDNYRRACRLIAALIAAQERVPIEAMAVVTYQCTLLPDTISDWSGLMKLNERMMANLESLDRSPASQQFKLQVRRHIFRSRAAILLRAGKLPEARAAMATLLKDGPDSEVIEDWLLLALIEHGLKNDAEAKRRMSQAQKWLASAPDRADWERLVGARILLAEIAKALADQ